MNLENTPIEEVSQTTCEEVELIAREVTISDGHIQALIDSKMAEFEVKFSGMLHSKMAELESKLPDMLETVIVAVLKRQTKEQVKSEAYVQETPPSPVANPTSTCGYTVGQTIAIPLVMQEAKPYGCHFDGAVIEKLTRAVTVQLSREASSVRLLSPTLQKVEEHYTKVLKELKALRGDISTLRDSQSVTVTFEEPPFGVVQDATESLLEEFIRYCEYSLDSRYTEGETLTRKLFEKRPLVLKDEELDKLTTYWQGGIVVYSTVETKTAADYFQLYKFSDRLHDNLAVNLNIGRG